MTGATRKACIIRFDSQIKGVIGEYEKVSRLNEIVKGLDVEASAYTDVDSAENIEYDELTKIQERRANIDIEIARSTQGCHDGCHDGGGPSCNPSYNVTPS